MTAARLYPAFRFPSQRFSLYEGFRFQRSMSNGIKLLTYVLLAVFALLVLKFLIKVSLLIAAVVAVVLLVGMFAGQKLR